jgi:hypothetical protein
MDNGPIANLQTGHPSRVMVGGVVLLSNATSGNVFDAIAKYPGLTPRSPLTCIRVTFEDIVVRVSANPKCGTPNGVALTGPWFRGSCSVHTATPGGQEGTLTGTTQVGVQFPTVFNAGVSGQSGLIQIVGSPVGLTHAEHFAYDDLLVQGSSTFRYY